MITSNRNKRYDSDGEELEESQTLSDIIQRARSIIVAPLIAGSLYSSSLLSSGDFLSAILCAIASFCITLILVSTLTIADLIHKKVKS